MKQPVLPLLPQPVLIFSQIFGVFPIKSSMEASPIGVVYSIATTILSFTHLYFMPRVMGCLEHQLHSTKGNFAYTLFLKMLFPTVVFATSSISKINFLCILRSNLKNCSDRVCRVDSKLEILAEDVARHRRHSVKILCAIAALTFPINLLRLVLFYRAEARLEALFLFADMYFQNLAICSHEMQFTNLTYGLVIRVRKINDRLRTLLKIMEFYINEKFSNFGRVRVTKICQKNIGTPNFGFDPKIFYNLSGARFRYRHWALADSLAELRKMHEDICDAALFVENAYGLPILFSLCCTGCMLLCDIYFEMYGSIGGDEVRPSFATYIWCTQYSVRFVFIAEAAQKMVEEVIESEK